MRPGVFACPGDASVRRGRPGRRGASSSYAESSGCSSYVEKKSRSSSAPAPPHMPHRNRIPGMKETIGTFLSTERYAKNASESVLYSPMGMALFRVPSRRPIKRAQLRQRTSPRTQSFLCRAYEMFGRSGCPTDAPSLIASLSVTPSKTGPPVLLGRCISGRRRPAPAVRTTVYFARLVFEPAAQDQQASVLACTERIGEARAWTPAEGIGLVMISCAIAIQRPQGVSGWRLVREGHGLYNSFWELASRVSECTGTCRGAPVWAH